MYLYASYHSKFVLLTRLRNCFKPPSFHFSVWRICFFFHDWWWSNPPKVLEALIFWSRLACVTTVGRGSFPPPVLIWRHAQVTLACRCSLFDFDLYWVFLFLVRIKLVPRRCMCWDRYLFWRVRSARGIAYCFSLEIVWLKDHVIYRVQTLWKYNKNRKRRKKQKKELWL